MIIIIIMLGAIKVLVKPQQRSVFGCLKVEIPLQVFKCSSLTASFQVVHGKYFIIPLCILSTITALSQDYHTTFIGQDFEA